MKTIIRNLVFAFVAIVLVSSCKKTVNLNDASQVIPKDATSVIAMNMQRLMQKADFETMKSMEFYQKSIAEAEKDNPAMAEILRNPQKSGIDFSKNTYIVQDVKSGEDTEMQSLVLLSLADATAFENMVKSGKTDAKIESKDGIKYLVHEKKVAEFNGDDDEDGISLNISRRNNNAFVAWNNSMAILGNNTEGSDFAKYFKPAAENIGKNEEFAKLFSTNHDFYSYTSLDKIANEGSIKTGAGMMGVDAKSLKDNYLVGYGDFENGQMIGHSEYKINKDLRRQFGIMFKDKVGTDFSKYIKGQNIGFAMTMALDVRGIKEIMNTNPQWRMVLEAKKGDKLDVDDLFKAFDGDMFIAANPTSGEKWQGVLGLKLRDKVAVDKLIKMLTDEKVIVAEGNNIYRFSGMADAMANNYTGKYSENNKLAIVDDVLFLGDGTAVSNLNSGGGLKSDVKDVLNKNIFGMYADFGKIFEANEDVNMKNPEFTEMKMMMNGTKGEAVLKTKDANENSLKSLTKAMNRWYLKSEADKAKQSDDKQKEEI